MDKVDQEEEVDIFEVGQGWSDVLERPETSPDIHRIRPKCRKLTNLDSNFLTLPFLDDFLELRDLTSTCL